MGNKRNIWDIILWTLTIFVIVALGVTLAKTSAQLAEKPETVTKVQTVIKPVEVEVPKVVTKVVTKTVTKEVEIPVEVEVKVPVEVIKYVTDEAAMNSVYISGYEDGRIEGEDWKDSQFRRALTTPCPTEDSDYCYWDASTMGNGQGTSFVVVDGETFYLGD